MSTSPQRLHFHELYLMSVQDIKKKLKNNKTNKRTVTEREFNKIMKLYLLYAFARMRDGYTWQISEELGKINIYKTICNRYQPIARVVRTENGKKVQKIIKYKPEIRILPHYWYFFFWNSPKACRTHRFVANRKWKSEMMKRVSTGFDYLDYTQIDRYDYIYSKKKKKKN